MKAFLSILLVFFLAAASRELSKKELKGTYVSSTGEAGRTIVKGDGSEMHLPPIIYSKTTLVLRSWGRCLEYSKQFEHNEGYRPMRGRWKLAGDSVYISFGGHTDAYFVQENGSLLHRNGAYVMHREPNY